MKKSIGIFLSCIMVGTLIFGCGSTTSKSSTNAKDKAEQGEKNIALDVILVTGHEAFETSINNYMKENPNVEVNIQKMPTEQFKTVIKTKFASNDAPDILPIFSGEENISYFDNGYIADLSDMTDVINRFEKGADSTLRTQQGNLYGLPVEKQLILGFYNKDLFAKYNLDVPTTWEKLMDVCETFKKNGITPIAMGHKDEWTTQMISYGLNATSVQEADPEFYKGIADNTKKFVESTGFLDTLTKYNELIDKQYIQEGSLSTTSDQQYEMFVREEAAMTFTGTWGSEVIDSLKPGFKVGGFELPGNDGEIFGASASINGGYGISAKSDNIEEAKKLLAYMVSAETLQEYLKGKGPSPYTDVKVELSDAIQECVDMEEGQGLYQFDNVYWAAGVQEVFFKSVQEMIAGQKEPLDILQAMDDATEKANR